MLQNWKLLFGGILAIVIVMLILPGKQARDYRAAKAELEELTQRVSPKYLQLFQKGNGLLESTEKVADVSIYQVWEPDGIYGSGELMRLYAGKDVQLYGRDLTYRTIVLVAPGRKNSKYERVALVYLSKKTSKERLKMFEEGRLANPDPNWLKNEIQKLSNAELEDARKQLDENRLLAEQIASRRAFFLSKDEVLREQVEQTKPGSSSSNLDIYTVLQCYQKISKR